jgi:hypothetical protein
MTIRTRVRKTLKVAGWAFGAVFLLLATFLGLLAFPGFLFAHKLEQGNLVAYSGEDLGGSFNPVLHEVERRLATSEINDQAITHRIFFAHGEQIFGALQNARAEILRRAIGVKPSPTYNVSWPPYLSHIVTFDVPDPTHDALRRQEWPWRFNLTDILTHEVTHTLVLAKVGLANISRLPMWKAEGYPEYIATTAIRTQAGYTLRASVARIMAADAAALKDANGNFAPMRYDCIGKSYLENERGEFSHTCYYLSRVLVEYLLDVKGVSFDQLVQPSTDETQTLNELLRDYRAGRL